MAETCAGDHYALVAVVHHGVYHVRLHVRVVVNHAHPVVEDRSDVGFPAGVTPDVVLLQEGELLGVHHCQGPVAYGPEGAPVAGMHLPHLGAPVKKTVLVAGGSEHAHHHLGGVEVGRRPGGVYKVQGCVAGGPVAGPLAAHQYNGNGKVLAHVGEGSGGVAQSIGAVAYHYAVDALLYLLLDGLCQGDVLNRTHVLAEDAEKLLRLEVADVSKFRNGSVQLARGEGGYHRACLVVQAAGDGAAGSQQFDTGILRVVGELLFGYLVMGLPGAEYLNTGHLGGRYTYVVACGQFQNDMVRVGGLAPGKDHPLENIGSRGEHHIVPYLDPELLHHFPGDAPVALEDIAAH